MKVYTIKYALTQGIEVHNVQHDADAGEDVYTHMGLGFQQFVMGKTAFLTHTEAAVAARAMRDKKVASVKKQLDRLTAMVFPTKEPE